MEDKNIYIYYFSYAFHEKTMFEGKQTIGGTIIRFPYKLNSSKNINLAVTRLKEVVEYLTNESMVIPISWRLLKIERPKSKSNSRPLRKI